MSADQFVLQATSRDQLGKGPSRRLRVQGRVPVVVYSHGRPGVNLSIDHRALLPVVHHAGLLTIEVADQAKPITAIIKDYSLHVLRGHLVHVDFQEVRVDEVITATVPVHPHGTPVGEAHGAILDQVLHEIDIRCPANQMPEQVEVDVSPLDLESSILASDITLPAGVELDMDGESVVFHMYVPRAEEEEEAGDEAEAKTGEEPEVISKGKQEESEEV